MSWPFTSVVAPNLDTGPGVAVPLAPTSITTDPAWLTGVHFTNSGANSVVVTITDSALHKVIELTIPPGGEQPYEWPFRPVTGVKWSADLAGVVGHLWGYK